MRAPMRASEVSTLLPWDHRDEVNMSALHNPKIWLYLCLLCGHASWADDKIVLY